MEIPKNDGISFRDNNIDIHGQTKYPMKEKLENKQKLFPQEYIENRKKIDKEEKNLIINLIKKLTLFEIEYSRSKGLRTNFGENFTKPTEIANEIKSKNNNKDLKEAIYNPRFKINSDKNSHEIDRSLNLNSPPDYGEKEKPSNIGKLSFERISNDISYKLQIYNQNIKKKIDKIEAYLEEKRKNEFNKKLRENSLPRSENRKPQQIIRNIPFNSTGFKEDYKDYRNNSNLPSYQISSNPFNISSSNPDYVKARGKSYNDNQRNHNIE